MVLEISSVIENADLMREENNVQTMMVQQMLQEMKRHPVFDPRKPIKIIIRQGEHESKI